MVILDPISGRIICSKPILDILHLNHNDVDQYDIEASQLYDSWLQRLSTAAPEFDDHCGRTIEIDKVDEGLVTLCITGLANVVVTIDHCHVVHSDQPFLVEQGIFSNILTRK